MAEVWEVLYYDSLPPHHVGGTVTETGEQSVKIAKV